MTLDLFAIDLEDGDSLASILREDRLRRDDRRSDGDAVNSSSSFGLAFGGTRRETSERLVSESRMLKGGTFDKLSTSCISDVTCSSSEESSIVMVCGSDGGTFDKLSTFNILNSETRH